MWPFNKLLRKEPAQNIAFNEPFWRELGLSIPSKSGENISSRTPLELTTSLRCGLVIADGVATVPCKLMFKDPHTGRRQEATDHPLYDLFNYAVNDWMDPLEFLATVTLHTVFGGNGYVFVNRVRDRIVELIPLIPESATVEQKDDYSLGYRIVAKNGSVQEFPQEAIWHMRGPSWNGYSGLDVTRLAREALGLAMATQNAHARRFGNGIQTTGMYSVEGTLDSDQYKLLKAWIEQNHVGARNSGKPFILDGNAKWVPFDLSGVDAQHVETRRLQIEEICRAYGVLPIMVGHSDKTATYASAEQMFLAHAVHTIRPWHRRFERSMKRSLLTKEEARAGYYFKFFDTELLRGAAKDRAEYYYKMFQMGMDPNSILALEDQDGFEGGDIHLVPAAMQTVENAKIAKAPSSAPNPVEPSPADPASNTHPRAHQKNAGRVLSSENEGKIRTAQDNLTAVLAKLDEQQET